MKIDSFALELHSEKIETTTVKTSFVDELQTENSKRSLELKSIAQELEFVKRLQYELMNKLMALFQTRTPSCQNSGYQAFLDKEIEPFDNQEFTTRKLSFTSEYTKYQKLDVSMSGCVKSGSQSIDLNMNLSFSSTFVQTHKIDRTIFYDPLVINFDGEMPGLDTQTFDFDIDMNGESDQISMLKKGNGFLALDKNNNGTIDDGFELFGTQNGNGFSDLKRFDSDHNGWIDENDPILDKLRIWKRSEGENELLALGEVGIGAIYLGNTKGNFDIRDDEKTLGRIKANGLYLNENGTSGFISQIDFAKHNKEKVNNSPSALNELLKSS